MCGFLFSFAVIFAVLIIHQKDWPEGKALERGKCVQLVQGA
jgi:hypothetical protein